MDYHDPVLLKEVLELLNPQPGQVIVDGTLGHGGHSLALLRALGDEGLLVGIERDPHMLATAQSRLDAAALSRSRYTLIHADHADLVPVVLDELTRRKLTAPDAILLDLGPSTPQLLDPARGMSWTSDTALDMRGDPTRPIPTAAELVNEWPEAELARIFKEHADERWAARVAKKIVEQRSIRPIATGRELGELVAGAIPRAAWPPKIHPATRVFMALRIEVNREFETIERVLPAAFDFLKPGGRLAVISFHSGEHRRVKEFMRRMTTPPEAPWPLPQGNAPAPGRQLTKKAVTATDEEMNRNPRSRSAQLRVLEKNPTSAP